MTTPNEATPLENEATDTKPVLEFNGDKYPLLVSYFTNKMIRHFDQNNLTLVVDELIGTEATDNFIDKYDDPKDLGAFLKLATKAVGSKNS